MATNRDDLDQADTEYAAAFNDDTPAPVEPSEDEAFGLTPEAAPAEEPAAEAAGPTTEAAEAGQGADAGGADPVETPVAAADEPAATEPSEPGDADAPPVNEDGPAAGGDESSMEPDVDPAKERQRLKSWEGRLRAQEAKLKGAPAETEPAAADAIEEVAMTTDNPELQAQASEVAEQVESGEMTPEQAMARLSEDFGEEFVKLIDIVATSKARAAAEKTTGDKLGELQRATDEIIADIVDTKQRTHFETISSKHPDFREVGQSPEFSAYVNALPEDEKADAERVVQSGSAKEIVKLLDNYKAAATKPSADAEPDPAVDAAMDAAEGVRTGGLKLPEAPAKAADGYESAWEQF